MSDNTVLNHIHAPAIFIGGHARTGTTLMHGQICKSKETIQVTKECSYLRALVEAYELGLRWFQAHTDDYFDTTEDLTRFHQGLVENYLAHVAARFGEGGKIVQKEPRLSPFFPELAYLMPNAKFIFMVRDLRDIIASQYTRYQKVNIQFDVAAEISQFISTHQRIMSVPNLLQNRLLFVRYEALAIQPLETLRSVFNFLELPWENIMEETSWDTKRPRFADSASELDCKPISRTSIGRYGSILNSALVEEFERERENLKNTIGFDCYFDSESDRSSLVNTYVMNETGDRLVPDVSTFEASQEAQAQIS